ncbi:helix-turn-helix transcriptional regulator [Phyllobacterium phragmitis]|nr:LuxR family transcriptional regulator [Phyllobacterium phragmitis]
MNFLDCAARIEQALTAEAIVGGLGAHLARFGFTACFITSLTAEYDKRWHEHVLINEWALAWYRHYTSMRHYNHDPCLARALRTADPFEWSDVRRETLHSRARQAMDEAAGFGLREGICIPVHAPFTPPTIVSVAGEAIDLAPAMKYMIYVLAQQAYRAAMRILPERGVAAAPKLTERQREVLQWTSAGKSAWEVSCILGISQNTVDAHVRNAKDRLDTANVVHSVVEALRRQEIMI